MARASNTATAEQVKKMLQANYKQLGTQYTDSDPVKVATAYEAFILDYLCISSRPVKTVIWKAACLAFEGLDQSQGDHFGRQIAFVVQHCRLKKKSISSGKKTAPAVLRICEALAKKEVREEMAARLGHAVAPKTKLWKGKRSLAKAVSDPKKAPLPVETGVVEKRSRRSTSSSSDIYARYGLPVPQNALNAGSGSMSIDVSSGDEDVDLEVVDFVDVSASKNKMVAALSPASSDLDETLSTLRFADMVKQIRTDPGGFQARPFQPPSDALCSLLLPFTMEALKYTFLGCDLPVSAEDAFDALFRGVGPGTFQAAYRAALEDEGDTSLSAWHPEVPREIELAAVEPAEPSFRRQVRVQRVVSVAAWARMLVSLPERLDCQEVFFHLVNMKRLHERELKETQPSLKVLPMKTARALYRDPAQNGLPDKPATNAISRLVNMDVVMAMQAGFGALYDKKREDKKTELAARRVSVDGVAKKQRVEAGLVAARKEETLRVEEATKAFKKEQNKKVWEKRKASLDSLRQKAKEGEQEWSLQGLGKGNGFLISVRSTYTGHSVAECFALLHRFRVTPKESPSQESKAVVSLSAE
ncbi:CML6, partial [Symbiodinium microadriaticum]